MLVGTEVERAAARNAAKERLELPPLVGDREGRAPQIHANERQETLSRCGGDYRCVLQPISLQS